MSQLAEIATRHQAHIERLKSHEVKTFTAYLKVLIKNTQFELLNNSELTEENRKGLQKRITAFKQILKDGFTDFKEEFDKIIIEFAEYEAGFEHRALKDTLKVDFALPSGQQIKTAVYTNPLSISGPDGGSLIDAFYKKWTDNEQYRIANIIQMGYANGKTNQQMAKELSMTGYGIIDRNMQTLIRTTMQHAANQARQATWDKNKELIKGVKWVSTLDKKTTSQCRSLDGIEFPRDKGPRPPLHPGCRSTTVATFGKEYDFLDKGATRFERDPETDEVGKVSANKTYYDWLKSQPAGVQDSIIGKTRGKLLRNGGLSSERFAALQLDKNFQPLTLKEMEKLEPVAFMKANIDV